jgi:kojibiose phosphorylase
VSNKYTKLVAFVSGDSDKVEEEVNRHIDTALIIGIDNLKDQHFKFWEKKWDGTFLGASGNDIPVKGLIYSTFQLLQCDNSGLFGMNIPARGLTSEYHHGHFFFNTELYMVPFYSWFIPDLAKSLLHYRIQTRDTALKNAEKLGCKGYTGLKSLIWMDCLPDLLPFRIL